MCSSALLGLSGPESIAARLALGRADVLVTTPKLYAAKATGVRDAVPSLSQVLLAGEDAEVPDGLYLRTLLRDASVHEIERTAPEDPALLHFTSGTTGTPKGALHVREARWRAW